MWVCVARFIMDELLVLMDISSLRITSPIVVPGMPVTSDAIPHPAWQDLGTIAAFGVSDSVKENEKKQQKKKRAVHLMDGRGFDEHVKHMRDSRSRRHYFAQLQQVL